MLRKLPESKLPNNAMKLPYIALLSALISFHFAGSASPLKIPGSSKVSTLPTDVLHEVVKRSDKFSRIEYVYGEQGDASFSKTQEDVIQGALDIMWTATSEFYETHYSAIYFPIYRGSLGIRIGIIKQENAALFANLKSLQALKSFTACQGKLWADTKILEANGVNVAASHKYFNLFPMLEGERCDYFPRAFFEPWSEIERESQYRLMVDEHMLIRYKLANFFFVKKGNLELANHIYDILVQMHSDGSYEAMFIADPDVHRGLSFAKLGNRKIFNFNNPYLTQAVREIPAEFWLNLDDEAFSAP